MADYQVEKIGEGLLLKQTYKHNFFFAFIFIPAGTVALYTTVVESSFTGLDFWIPLVISLGVLLGGIYVLFEPFKLNARISKNAIRIEETSLFKKSLSNHNFSDIEEIMISKSESSEGDWFLLKLKFNNGKEKDIGDGHVIKEHLEGILKSLANLDGLKAKIN